MTEQRLRLTQTIDAPVEQVWEVLTDLSRAASRLSGIESIQIMTSGPYAVGTRWRETRTFFGRAATEEMWVRSNDPLRSTVVEASSGGAAYITTWRLAPHPAGEDQSTPAGTRVSVEFVATGPDGALTSAVTAVLGPLGLRVTDKALQRDLDDIAVAAGELAVG
ncbi:hypothetical protein BH23ACT6_BH23ACT6_16990 [soil metagenome]